VKVEPTFAYALTGAGGLLVADADGRALVFATEEQAHAAQLTHDAFRDLVVTVVAVVPAEDE
jgi:hypothetical protein